MAWTLLADRGDLSANRLAQTDLAFARVLQFALTANVVTYAMTGARFGYWRLFPATAPWIVPPAWGEVDHGEGARYGLVPVGSHTALKLEPVRGEWRETSPHRAALDPGYNRYLPATGTIQEREDKMLFRPLVTLGWALARWLRAQEWFDARRVVVTSASSKTALGFAMQASDGPPLLGLTGDTDFVERAALYARVSGYEEPIAFSGDDLVLDFAGNAARRVRRRSDGGPRIIAIGATHGDDAALAGRDVFFAPEHVGAAIAADGLAAVERARDEAVATFAQRSRPWFNRTYLDGSAAILEGFRALLSHDVAADLLLIARPHGDIS
ncbi:DUF2855 family protein [Sphingomonas sp. TX0522]|nr:DUF2855 family protein [Sphingomonas sp. TX0522]